MSIKYKVLLMIAALFFLNIVILIIFFQLSIPHFEDEIVDHQWRIEVQAKEFSQKINNGTMENGLEQLRDAVDTDRTLSFVLEDVATRERIYVPHIQRGDVEVFAYEPVALSRKSYMLVLKRDIGVMSSVDGTLLELTVLEFVTLTIFFLICGTIIHIRYVQPILKLKNETANFLRYGYQLKPSKRSDELGELENSIYHMTEELTAENDKQARIIASISHDIKTPLTSLMGFTERLIKKDLSKEKQSVYLNNIYTKARNIESIMGDFDEYLDYSHGRREQLRKFDILYACKLLEDEYTDICAEYGVIFELQNYCRTGISIEVDIPEMRRVFANLIKNALCHNDHSGLKIIVSVREEEEHVTFRIADNGKGVLESELPHIFEPFYTSDESRKLSGLGLAICKAIMRTHGGDIWAENTDNGFAVSLSIPKI